MGKPCVTLGNLREPWGTLGNLGEPWGTLCNLREPRGTLWNLPGPNGGLVPLGGPPPISRGFFFLFFLRTWPLTVNSCSINSSRFIESSEFFATSHLRFKFVWHARALPLPPPQRPIQNVCFHRIYDEWCYFWRERARHCCHRLSTRVAIVNLLMNWQHVAPPLPKYSNALDTKQILFILSNTFSVWFWRMRVVSERKSNLISFNMIFNGLFGVLANRPIQSNLGISKLCARRKRDIETWGIFQISFHIVMIFSKNLRRSHWLVGRNWVLSYSRTGICWPDQSSE